MSAPASSVAPAPISSLASRFLIVGIIGLALTALGLVVSPAQHVALSYLVGYAYWTAISIGIAVPLSWYGMHKWIEGYAYQAPLSWWIFAASSAGILLITLLTVSYQSLKAALMNPVRSLRTE